MLFSKNKHFVCKEYCLIGLNNFNYQIAKVLKKEGQKVTVIDNKAEIINLLGNEFDNSIVCDATNIKELEDLGIKFFDYVIVGVNNIEKSITICSNLKELDVRKIMAKAKHEIHKRILKTMGILYTVIPELEIAEKLAYQTMFDLNVDLFSFDSTIKDTFIVRFPVYNSDLWDKKISEISFLKTMSTTVISIKRFQGEIIVPVSADDILKRADIICLITKKDCIKDLKNYFMKNIILEKQTN